MSDYIIYHEQKCPDCGETGFAEGGFVEIDHDEAWQRIRCENCGCTYTEVYGYKYTVLIQHGDTKED